MWTLCKRLQAWWGERHVRYHQRQAWKCDNAIMLFLERGHKDLANHMLLQRKQHLDHIKWLTKEKKQ